MGWLNGLETEMLTETLLDLNNQKYMTDSNIREMAQKYAAAFDPANGDSLAEYCERASFDVYPASVFLSGRQQRIEFSRLVKASIRELAKS